MRGEIALKRNRDCYSAFLKFRFYFFYCENGFCIEFPKDGIVIKKTRRKVNKRLCLPINLVLFSKANWIGHILRKNCLLHDAIEGQMMEVKGVGRRTQLLDDLTNRKIY